jgi:tRNA-dihydrouridine synthase B
MKLFKIGSINVKNRVLLAPMLDITDLPYRLLCKELGAGIVYTEMLHVEAIKNGGKKIRDKMKFSELERPVGIQITSRTLKGVKDIVDELKEYDLVDINCGCPSHLTIDHGSGVYLMKSPLKVAKMIKILKDNGVKNVSVKMRLGLNKNNVIEFAKKMEDAGADAITVHGRLGNQDRSVKADWKEIKKVKDHVKIPVIGNGDVIDGKTALELLEFCDGVMVARAAIGDPDIFYRISKYIEDGKELNFDFKKNIKLFKKYLVYCEKYDLVDLAKIKYVGSNFIRETKGAAKLRLEFNRLKSFEDIKKFIDII